MKCFELMKNAVKTRTRHDRSHAGTQITKHISISTYTEKTRLMVLGFDDKTVHKREKQTAVLHGFAGKSDVFYDESLEIRVCVSHERLAELSR